MKLVDGTTAIITGAGSGLGRACANVFARAGVAVVVTDIDADAAQRVADEASEHGTAASLRIDVTADDAFVRARDFALDTFGRVDIVMNNVGALAYGHPQDIPVEEWRRIFDVNVLALVRSNATFVPHLVSQGHGHIVNTASTAGLYTYAWNRTPYAATKASVISLSEALAVYLRPQGVGVTLLCPASMTNTSIITAAREFGTEARPVVRGQSPGFPPMEVERVGELVLDAIRNDQFLLLTHPDDIQPILVARAQDPEGFVERAAARLAADLRTP
jgi:NAD(P)-dependent dehydrogenase (short-subunit alcohol dehydrogenase family)